MTTFDVCVVGGGVIGGAIALAAADQGARVVQIADDGPAASQAAAGMLCPSFEAMHEGGRGLAALGAASLALWDGFAARLGDDLDYRRGGALGVGYPPGMLRGQPAAVPPGIAASGAVLVPNEGQVDPRRVVGALTACCRAIGVVRRSAVVTQLREANGEIEIESAAADGEAISARRVVLATGATPGLAPSGLMRPVRGRAIRARLRAPLSLPGAGVLRSPSVYLCEKGDGTLYVGATEEEQGDRPGEAMLNGLWHEACWLVPALRDAERLGVFDGLRPTTVDGLPVVGPDPERGGVFLALGHHRNGVLLAPLTARRAAAWATA